MSKIYRTDVLSKTLWVILHPISWYNTRNVRRELDNRFKYIDEQLNTRKCINIVSTAKNKHNKEKENSNEHI